MRPVEWIIVAIKLVQSITGCDVESLASFSHTPESIKISFLMAITSLTEGEKIRGHSEQRLEDAEHQLLKAKQYYCTYVC
jgi:hypothetical protein